MYIKTVQQIVKNECVMDGVHYSNNVDFLDANISHFSKMLKQVEDFSHISLFKNYAINPFELQVLLYNAYTKTIKTFFTNQINLSFSEN